MKSLYHSLINSKLQYGIIVWGATFKSYLSEVNVRINSIIRALRSSNLYTPMSSLYKKLNLLKLEDLYKVELEKLRYLHYNKKTPKIFHSFFQKLQKFTVSHRRTSPKKFVGTMKFCPNLVAFAQIMIF